MLRSGIRIRLHRLHIQEIVYKNTIVGGENIWTVIWHFPVELQLQKCLS